MKHQLTGKMMQIVITNQKIFYDWKKNERSQYYITIGRFCKKGYITTDVNGREIGITFEADDPNKDFCGSAYMLFFKKYVLELGQWRLVKTKFDKTFPFSKLEVILETQDKFDDLQVEI